MKDHLTEYLLVAHPDQAVNEKIVEEKKWFYQAYEQEIAANAKPHITVAKFLVREAMEETLARWIGNICRLQSGFTVTLNNYSGFPPHTIYLRVVEAEPFQKMASALRILDSYIQSNDCPPLEFVSKPHLAIARRLPFHIYEKAISEYSRRSFYESFRVERLVLLRRDTFMKRSIVETFALPLSPGLLE